ncbi:hypothetical protein Pcinc_033564, partial [Petrolisthes cinctipes]
TRFKQNGVLGEEGGEVRKRMRKSDEERREKESGGVMRKRVKKSDEERRERQSGGVMRKRMGRVIREGGRGRVVV